MKQLPTVYRQQIHISKYSRWRDDLYRREQWEETVDRYINFIDNKVIKLGSVFDDKNEIRQAILDTNVLPSMRAMMTAGPAADRDNVAMYNCSFVAVNRPKAFDEAMYILCCGTGVGFSVEQKHISKLPYVPDELFKEEDTIVVADSKIGWASSYRRLINALYGGSIPQWDVSKVRPKGARLKTFGGRASGPEPLEDLFRYTINVFEGAKGRQLTSIECHGLMCKVAEIIVVGGVRRSALISLSDIHDDKMRKAKAGQWWDKNPEFRLANNSAVYISKPTPEEFLYEWQSLIESKSGERGIINRKGFKDKIKEKGIRDHNYDFGTNPCGEIILRDKEFCNLSEVVIRSEDKFDDVAEKVRKAVILGTIQSSFTDFRYLSKEWKQNCEEERLLGASLTGIYDNPTYYTPGKELEKILTKLNKIAQDTNYEWASRLGIPPSVAICCVKPSGTASKLADASNGIHPRFAPFYINTNRMLTDDPVAKLLADSGVYSEPDVTDPNNTSVFYYPQKAPKNAKTVDDVTALQQLELWMTYSKFWCDHNPSITVYVKDEEWVDVAAYVYKNFDDINGISFLPKSDHIYKQAPFQEITEDEYNDWLTKTPDTINWDLLATYELEDATSSSHELACSANGGCEIDVNLDSLEVITNV